MCGVAPAAVGLHASCGSLHETPALQARLRSTTPAWSPFRRWRQRFVGYIMKRGSDDKVKKQCTCDAAGCAEAARGLPNMCLKP